MEESNNPLVSVLIITYNSSKYVIDTLESVKNQTYSNLELVVSDDCSSDETVNICKHWINLNKARFKNVVVVEAPYNTGTAGNCNRALNVSTGVWLKFFGADDILMPNAIQQYVDFVEKDRKDIVIAEAIHFSGNIEEKKYTFERIALENTVFSKKITAKQQYKILSKIFIGSGPTLFLSRECVERVGGFDERYPLQEDYPLFIQLTKAGYKMHLMPIDTVYKRVHNESVSHATESNAIYPSMIVRCVSVYKYAFKRSELNLFWSFLLSFSLWLYGNVIESGNDRTSLKCRIFYILQRALDPFEWYTRVLNLMDKFKNTPPAK